MSQARDRLWQRTIRAGKALDARPGLSRNAVRLAFSVFTTATPGGTVKTLRWVPSEQRYHHRFPEGRVEDARFWRSAAAWQTHGGLYDIDDLLWRHYRPGPGDTVLDIGAGNGGEVFSLAPMVGKSGRIIAIEAAPGPFADLTRLCAHNDFTQVECVQAAVSDDAGTLMIADDGDWIAGNVYAGTDGGIEVPAVTIDELCASRGIERVDWLKMNIEGAERDALRGMEQMVPNVASLTISTHDFLGTEWGRTKEFVLGWLREHGFEVEENGSDDPVFGGYVYAWR